MAEHDIPGPDWSDAPSWAQWWAMDYMGAWWYKQKPSYVKIGAGPRWFWYSQAGAFEEDRSVRPGQGIDYRETLRKRPEVQNDY